LALDPCGRQAEIPNLAQIREEFTSSYDVMPSMAFTITRESDVAGDAYEHPVFAEHFAALREDLHHELAIPADAAGLNIPRPQTPIIVPEKPMTEPVVFGISLRIQIWRRSQDDVHFPNEFGKYFDAFKCAP